MADEMTLKAKARKLNKIVCDMFSGDYEFYHVILGRPDNEGGSDIEIFHCLHHEAVEQLLTSAIQQDKLRSMTDGATEN